MVQYPTESDEWIDKLSPWRLATAMEAHPVMVHGQRLHTIHDSNTNDPSHGRARRLSVGSIQRLAYEYCTRMRNMNVWHLRPLPVAC
eukprot:scaffold28917_cov49-Attheya_sp.AAC.3